MTRVTNFLIKENTWGFTVNLLTAEFNMTSLKIAKYGDITWTIQKAIGSYNCVKYTSVPSNSIHYYFATLIGVSNLLIAIIDITITVK